MILHDKFIYIHLQKTGGTFISDFLLKHLKTSQLLGKHSTVSMLNGDLMENKIIVGSIRNPFEWYVSHYHYQKQGDLFLFKNVLNSPKNFNEYLNRLLDKGYNSSKKDVLFKKEDNTIDYDKIDIGNYTINFIRSYCMNIGETVNDISVFKTNLVGGEFIRNENLRNDIATITKNLGIELNENSNNKLMNSKKMNTTNHKHFKEYYTSDLINLVKKNDYTLLNYFNYEF